MVGWLGTVHKEVEKRLEEMKIRGPSRLQKCKVQKSLGDLRRLAVNQTPMKDHLPTKFFNNLHGVR